jgi:hypothetical protein
MVPTGNMLSKNDLPRASVPDATVPVASGTHSSQVISMKLTDDATTILASRNGRDSRSESFATRFTRSELTVLSRTAAKDGMKVREWAREALLREARRADDPMFTELIATRMILLNLLKPLAMGQVVTPEDFTRISATVRSDKRKVAQAIQQQYTNASQKEV